VLERDYLTPELAVDFGTEVRVVVLEEPDVENIAANMKSRGADGRHDDVQAS
jgi:hypothetical protein